MKYIFFLILFPFYLFAVEKPLKLGWKPVAGSNGYQLEIKGEMGFTKILQLETNNADFSLEPGKYAVRVAVLNKFKKPAKFSEWKNLELEDISDVQEFDLASQEKELKKKIKVVQKSSIPFWKVFVPGLVQWQENKTKASLIWTGFGIVLGYNYVEKRKGDVLAGEYENKQNYILPLLFYSPEIFGPLALYQRHEDRRVYDLHQENQRRAGVLLFTGYLLSTLDSYLIRKKLLENTDVSLFLLPVGESSVYRFQFTIRF